MSTATLPTMRDMRGPDETEQAKATAANAAWPTFIAGWVILTIGACAGSMGGIMAGALTVTVGIVLLAIAGKVFPK